MKKLIYSGVFFALIGIFLVACNKEGIINPQSNLQKLKFESFEKYGQIHNDFLTNVKDNFQINEDINSGEEALNYVNKFQQNFLSTISLEKEDKTMLSKSLEQTKELIVYDYAYLKMFSSSEKTRKSSSLEEMSLFELIEDCKNKELIDEFEYVSLLELGEKVKESYEGIISDNELKTFVLQLKNEWIEKGYTIDSKNGRIMVYTIAISLASLQWWEENPEGIEKSKIFRATRLLPAWASADIGGAIWGGATGAIASYIASGGEGVSWEAVGIGALSGAISTSTGAAAKLGKWITSLF